MDKLRVVYFIQTHNNMPQVRRLINTIRAYAPEGIIVIGHDGRFEKFDRSIINDLENVHLLENHFAQYRGDFSLLRPYLEAVTWLREQGIAYDWITYLSGQHYPTQSPAAFEAYLAKTDYDGFITHWSLNSPEGQAEAARIKKRYYYQYYRFPEKFSLLYRVLFKVADKLNTDYIETFPNYGNLMGKKAAKTPFNANFECYRGYQWTTLSSRCVNYLLDFMAEQPEVVNYFRKTVVSDEAFVQTVLANNPAFKLCSNNLLFHEFEDAFSGRPRIMTVNDIDTLRSEQFFFARKFDMNTDSDILDMLDRHFAVKPA